MRSTFAALALISVSVAPAQQPTCQKCQAACPVPAFAARAFGYDLSVPAVGAIEWKPVAGCPHQMALFVGGYQRGSVDRYRNVWRSYDPVTRRWADEEVELWPVMIPASVGPIPTAQDQQE